MKANQLAESFEAFENNAVIINTKLQITTPEGIGIMSYRGILIDKDDFMLYLGYNSENITTAIKWDDVATIEIFDVNAEMGELSGIEPESGSKN